MPRAGHKARSLALPLRPLRSVLARRRPPIRWQGMKEHLRSLRECLEEGLITKEEFEHEKAELLKSMRPCP